MIPNHGQTFIHIIIYIYMERERRRHTRVYLFVFVRVCVCVRSCEQGSNVLCECIKCKYTYTYGCS